MLHSELLTVTLGSLCSSVLLIIQAGPVLTGLGLSHAGAGWVVVCSAGPTSWWCTCSWLGRLGLDRVGLGCGVGLVGLVGLGSVW